MTAKDARRVSLRHTVGFWLRYHRESGNHPKLTQDQVAAAAQRLGFAWSRSSIAAIEAGDRDISAEELLALPFIISEAVVHAFPNLTAAGMSLFEVLKPGTGEHLVLGDGLALSYRQARRYVDEGNPAYRVEAAG